MNSSKIHANISIAKQFVRRRTYRTVGEKTTVDADRFTAARAAVIIDDDVGADGSEKTAPAETSCNSGWKTTHGGSSEQSRTSLPKNLIRPLPYRITKPTGSGDLLSHPPVHAGAQDEVDYGGGARHEIAKPGLVRCVTAAQQDSRNSRRVVTRRMAAVEDECVS